MVLQQLELLQALTRRLCNGRAGRSHVAPQSLLGARALHAHSRLVGDV